MSSKKSAVPTGSATQTVFWRVQYGEKTIDFTEEETGECLYVKDLKSLISDREEIAVKDQTLILPGKGVLPDDQLMKEVCNGKRVNLQLQNSSSPIQKPSSPKEERKVVCETDERKYHDQECGTGANQYNGDQMRNGNLGRESRADKREYMRNKATGGTQINGDSYA